MLRAGLGVCTVGSARSGSSRLGASIAAYGFGVSEVLSNGRSEWVVIAQQLLTVGEGLLVQGDGAAQVPRLDVGPGEVAAADQGIGVLFAQLVLLTGFDTTCHSVPRTPCFVGGRCL